MNRGIKMNVQIEELQEARTKQKQILVKLKAANVDLERARKLVQAEREFNKGNKTLITSEAAKYRIIKDNQLSLLNQLKAVNADLKILRPLVDNSKPPKSSSNNEKAAEREAIKNAKREEKEAKKRADQQHKDAKRQLDNLAREARREERRLELEEQNKPARGYNIPLLTDMERSGTKVMNNVFATVAKQKAQSNVGA